jgi:hypothetical protein
VKTEFKEDHNSVPETDLDLLPEFGIGLDIPQSLRWQLFWRWG